MVDRCICHNILFTNIREICREKGIASTSELQKEDISCNGCGFCKPYIELMFKTGEISFEPGAYYKRNF